MARLSYDELVALGLEPERAAWLAGATITNEPSAEALDRLWGLFEADVVAEQARERGAA